jgi:hypothetical protein
MMMMIIFIYYTNMYILLCFDGNFKTFCFTCDVVQLVLPFDGTEKFKKNE